MCNNNIYYKLLNDFLRKRTERALTELTEIIDNEKDKSNLFFEKYHLSLTSIISIKTSSN